MAKKTLNEATIRRFQKLANVAPLNEMYHKRDEEMEEGMHLKDEDMHEQEEEEAGTDLAPADDAGADNMDGDLELTDEEAQAIIDLGAKLEAAMGDDMGGDDMGGDDMGADDMGADDMGGDDMGEEELMEALRGISYVPSQGEIVNEVAQRVARRLKQAKLHEAKLNRALGKRR